MKKFFAIILIAAGFFLGLYSQNYLPVSADLPSEESSATSTAHIVINSGSGFATVIQNFPFKEGDSLFTVLQNATKENKIEFKYKDYGGDMGVFIESLASSTNRRDKWWQYWVNGQFANTGVSNYKVKNGDIAEFKLEAEQIKN